MLIPLAVAAVLGGCSNKAQILEDKNEGGFFQKKMFETPSWARPSAANVSLGPSGPVDAADLVGPDGACAPAAGDAQAAAPAPQPAPAAAAGGQGVGFEGGLESGVGGPGAAANAPVLGGIALGMSECDAVRRAGRPSNVAISAGAGGERKVVLTYAAGPWPGIYTFASGRLKEVDAVPEPERPKKPAPKKKPAKRAKSASSAGRVYVQ